MMAVNWSRATGTHPLSPRIGLKSALTQIQSAAIPLVLVLIFNELSALMQTLAQQITPSAMLPEASG
jgi:hypothetical protein